MKAVQMKSTGKLSQWVCELRDHPIVVMAGFGVGVFYALGAYFLDHIALARESAMFSPDLLANLPFLAALAVAALLLLIMVRIFARKGHGVVFVISIFLGAVAGFFVYAVARSLAV
jgi:hypothetical protein